MTRAALGAASALAALLPLAVHAADHTNLDENLPVRLTDAYPIPFNSIEAQGYFSYDRNRLGSGGRGGRGSDAFTLSPQLEVGAFRNTQVSISAPYRLGNASETKQGDFVAQALYNFNSEGQVLPALALQVGVDQPFGHQHGGTETSMQGIATKSIGSFGTSYVPRQLYLNAIWFHNYDPLSLGEARERRDRYLVGVAYSQPLTNDAVLVADIYREQLRESTRAQNIVQVGVRYQLDPQTVLSGSVGTGFADRSPAFVGLVGFQHTLSWPLLFH